MRDDYVKKEKLLDKRDVDLELVLGKDEKDNLIKNQIYEYKIHNIVKIN